MLFVPALHALVLIYPPCLDTPPAADACAAAADFILTLLPYVCACVCVCHHHMYVILVRGAPAAAAAAAAAARDASDSFEPTSATPHARGGRDPGAGSRVRKTTCEQAGRAARSMRLRNALPSWSRIEASVRALRLLEARP